METFSDDSEETKHRASRRFFVEKKHSSTMRLSTTNDPKQLGETLEHQTLDFSQELSDITTE